MKRNKLISILVVLAVAWGAMFYSGKGFLVWRWADTDTHMLSCWYLGATGPVKRTKLFLESKAIGSGDCGPTIDVD